MKQEAVKRQDNEKGILLDPDRKSPRAAEFEDKLSGLIVGQERAVRRMSGLFQIYLASMGIVANAPIELIRSGIDTHDLSGTVVKEAVRKASRG